MAYRCVPSSFWLQSVLLIYLDAKDICLGFNRTVALPRWPHIPMRQKRGSTYRIITTPPLVRPTDTSAITNRHKGRECAAIGLFYDGNLKTDVAKERQFQVGSLKGTQRASLTHWSLTLFKTKIR
ncbi:hypothetical protein BGW80DRAFT_1328329 [Lactifluus volemus]|nr:hypothetical protein BGW80DRAFT_1328329 [Lactifluus volemus]